MRKALKNDCARNGLERERLRKALVEENSGPNLCEEWSQKRMVEKSFGGRKV